MVWSLYYKGFYIARGARDIQRSAQVTTSKFVTRRTRREPLFRQVENLTGIDQIGVADTVAIGLEHAHKSETLAVNIA